MLSDEIMKEKKPFVRDPAMPYHDVARSGIKDWTQFRNEINAWMESITF